MKVSVNIFVLFILFCFSNIVYAQENETKQKDELLRGPSQERLTSKKIPLSLLEGGDSEANPNTKVNTESSKEISTTSLAAASSASTDAGSIPGDLSVSSTGAASYSVPIYTPPGIKDVVPNIAITYNSQAGNGLAGWGWNISGLSTITRVGPTDHHDGQKDGVTFTSTDRFALDGQRLIAQTGTYGADGTVYQTDNYSNLKIISYGTSPYGSTYGPSYFIVFYPDGSRAWYGNAGGSRGRLEWAIYKMQDPQGNFIEYTYATSNNLLRITKIAYGSRTGTSAPFSIDFLYKARARTVKTYVADQFFKRYYILDYVQVSYSGTLLRKYQLSHKRTSLGYETISKIQEFNGASGSFEPITFSYDTTSNGISQLTKYSSSSIYPGINRSNSSTLAGDYNGDGKMDLISYYDNQKNKINVFTDLHKGSSLNLGWEVNTGSFNDIVSGPILSYNNKVLSQHGITTISESLSSTTSSTSDVIFKTFAMASYGAVYQYTKTWNAPTYLDEYNCSSVYKQKTTKKYISGDFNGDGLMDVIALTFPYTETFCNPVSCDGGGGGGGGDPQPIQKAGTKATQVSTARSSTGSDCCECTDYSRSYSKSYFIDLDRSKTSSFSNYSGQLSASLSYNDRVFAADVTGNGKTELIHLKEGKIYVYAMDNKYKSLRTIVNLSDSYIKKDTPILIGDYNGDGKMDLATPTASGSSSWRFFIFKGTNFYVYNKAVGVYRKDYTSGSYLYEYQYIAQDFNGDGNTDILEHSVKTSSADASYSYEVFSLYTNSITTGDQPYFVRTVNKAYSSTGAKPYGIPIFLEAQYSNQNLEYGYISGNTLRAYSFLKDNRRDLRLNSISNNGMTQSITYTPLSPYTESYYSGSVYNSDYNETYPFVNINVARNVLIVKQLSETGSGITRKQDFAYEGAVVHAQGLGFMGFKILHRSNWYGTGVTQLWNTSKHSPQKRGAVTEEWSANYKSNSTSNYIEKTTYTYTTTSLGNKVYVNFPTKLVIDNKLQGVTSTRNITYDSYYNPTNITLTNASGGHTELYTYSNNPSSTSQYYHIGRPTVKKVTSTINGDSFYTEEQYGYSNNLMTSNKRRGNGTPWVTLSYQYDAFGNITNKKLSASGMTTRNEYFGYASGRFINYHKDIEGIATTFIVDNKTGNVARKTETHGNTYYYYDDWGRLIKETDYLNKSTNITYEKVSGGGMRTYTNYDQGQDTYEYINALGWPYLTSTMSLNGEWINSSFKHDAAGRIVQSSEPYWSTASASQWNITDYDEYGRIIEQRSFTGKTTSITYSGLITTVNDGSKSVVTTLDSAGNVVKVQDPGGTITYTYYGNGVIKEANFGGQKISVDIDLWGRKTKLVDPSAGTYTYTYNLYGEVTKETTPKGATSYTYDGLGKLTKTTIIGDETDLEMTYTYNSDKLLTSINGQDKKFGKYYNYNFYYDSSLRTTKVVEDNDLARFEKQYTYDAYGRPLRESFITSNKSDGTASTVRINNHYDTDSGILEEIKDSGNTTSLWKLNSHDQRGQATNIAIGNGFVQSTTYDSYGLLKNIRDTKGSGSTAIHALRMDYSFNAQRGILNSRKNYAFNWNESFTHDNLDRLTKISGSVTRDQNYDSLGRIDDNSTVGDYNYDSGKKYRLASIDLNNSGQSYFTGREQQYITYNAFKKPVDIYEEGKGKVSFEYSVMGNRAHAWYGGLDNEKEQLRYHKHYSAIMPVEIVEDKETNNTKIISYLGGDGYTASMAFINTKNNSLSGFHYLHRDYLGSILAITDASGNVKEQRQFGAWGTVDKFLASNGKTSFGHDSILGRGYTGHEHFFEVGLVHMNGRMYDPQLGRFMGPDNFVQNPYNTQSYNRYGYVLNSPLKYIDPSGEYTEPNTLYWVGAAVVSSFITSFNWLKEQGVFRSINRWFNKHIKGPIDDFFDWIHGRNKKSAPPPAHEPLPTSIISIDPLVVPNANVGPINTGSGGGSALNTLWTGYKDGFKGFYSNLWNSARELFTNPMSIIQNELNKSFGQRVQDAILQTWDTMMPGFRRGLQMQIDNMLAAQAGDVYQVGYIQGEIHGELSFEVGSTVAGGYIGKFFKGLGGIFKRSKNITYLTKKGNYPSWSTVKSRYWKMMNDGKVLTGKAEVRVRSTGEIKTIDVSKELHHINGRTGADPHRFNNLKEVWPWEHEAIDPFRHTGYDFIRWVE